jgi:SAM-dependent methyltransferase
VGGTLRAVVKDRLLDWIVCPHCRADLVLLENHRVGDEIVEGVLGCTPCGARYPIVRGVPRLLPAPLSTEAAATADRFGYEWTRFPELRPEYEAQFLGWIAPMSREAFAGRVVLDAGCGKGRHLRLAARFGAREAIGIDLGPAVEAAAGNTRDLPAVHVVQGDLTRPPIRAASIDLVYSIGVLHHLGEPAAGYRALVPLLAPGGRLVSWTYAREGNGWVLALVDPLRRLTSRMPLPVVSGLAWALAVPLWVALRLLYGPGRARPWLGRWLPYRGYLFDLADFAFREVHSIAFDQLLAPVAHYMPREEVERCFRTAGLSLRSLRWHHGNSWAAWGEAGISGTPAGSPAP